MPSLFDDLVQITEPDTAQDVRRLAMRDFAEQLKWTPSYELQASLGVDAVADHVVVEHGLSNSAVITFLRGSYRASELDQTQLRSLLSISYNNLVEWHLFVSQGDVRRIHNLVDPSSSPSADAWFPLSPNTFSEQVSFDSLTPFNRLEINRRNLRACDDALISVISRWKRLLKADYPNITNEGLSTLFNAIIFVRGCEDRRLDLGSGSGRLLTRLLSNQVGNRIDVSVFLREAFIETKVEGDLDQYLDLSKVQALSELDRMTAHNLMRDFYAPKEAAYDFNFALMSKHALSRIYKRFVSLLVAEEVNSLQLSFIAAVPEERTPLRTGAI